ncbi:MAG: phosphate ABC transporter permease PstA [Candidatus Dormibacteria bacterium]
MSAVLAARRRELVRATAQRSLARRRLTGRTAQAMCAVAAVAAVAPLVTLLYYTVSRGAGALSWSFLVNAPTPPTIPGGGISTAIVGSAEIVGLALVLAIPTSLLAALFLFERSGRLAAGLRFSADVLTGVPSIIIGIFAYALLVLPLHQFGNLAAAFALAVLMLPIMIRADEEAMRTIALDLWEAGIALGARRGRVARSVVLRGALPDLVTGNLLAIARAVGETAPLLFTLATPLAAMTLLIYTDGTQAFRVAQETAWGTALVLLGFVLLLSVAAKIAAWRISQRAR